jgi:hypothetical protein
MLGVVLSLLLSILGSDSSSKRIVIDTTSLGPNAAQVLYADEGKVRVTVTRNGEVRRIRVERAGPLVIPTSADEYVVEPVDGQLRAREVRGRGDFIIPPSRILVDGIALDAALPFHEAPPQSPRRKSLGARYFICPSDETMVRVTVEKEVGELKCPVDGTPMRETAGQRREYYLLQ